MGDTSHTPSPWIFADQVIDGEEDIVIEHEGCHIITVRGTNDMSCIDEEQIEPLNKEVIATAKLVIAAPELLQCLKTVMHTKPHKESISAMKRLIESVIKKATL